MKQAELIQLELGNYKLTDDIYHYSLDKLGFEGKIIYQIKEIGRSNILTIHPQGDNELISIMSVGGIHIQSDDIDFSLRNLKLVK